MRTSKELDHSTLLAQQLEEMRTLKELDYFLKRLTQCLLASLVNVMLCSVVVASEEVVVMKDSAPPGVVWVVQMSDIHLSKWTPSRGLALRKVLGRSLKVIQPAVVLVSGDLTDAKSVNMMTAQQFEVEWIQYHDSFREIATESGIPLEHFFDLRGNHDKYGVPLHSPLDYYSKYSISAAFNRTSLVQSVIVQGSNGGKHLFVGFDDSMEVGLRHPSNLFGHPTDAILKELDEELKSVNDTIAKIVYGHFPMSFTTYSETGKLVEDVMANNNVNAYVCGHLHTAFGRELYKYHKEKSGDFWEWEMGDWRISRMMRVMAIDHGHTSFVDVELIPPMDTAEGEYKMPTIILQTYPLDSKIMLRDSKGDATSFSIRALVFSETPLVQVYASIYDMRWHSTKKVKEIVMKEIDQGTHYYVGDWDGEQYKLSNYGIQVVAKDKDGNVVKSKLRSVSSNGERTSFYQWSSPVAFLILFFKWERLYPYALWIPMGGIITLLVFSGIHHWRLQKNGEYDKWMKSVSTHPWSVGKVFKCGFGGLVSLYSRSFKLWVLLLGSVLYLSYFPWFWGRVLADDYPTGSLSVHGWTVKPSKGEFVESVSGLGKPDNVVIVMTHLYLVLIPLVVVISILGAEREVFEAREVTDEEISDLIRKRINATKRRRDIFDGKWRKVVFVGGLGIGVILLKLCLIVGRAYGFVAIATAFVYAWAVPFLLLFTFYETSSIRGRSKSRDLGVEFE